MTNPPDEKRASARVPFVLRVDFPDRARWLAATENLSREGLFLQTERPFSMGERVVLALSFPGLLDPVQVSGTVTWVRPASATERPGVGIRADGVDDRRRLDALLSSVTSESPARPVAPAPAEGFRVLIVEDNPHIIEMYSYVLKKLAQGELAGKVPLQVHFAQDGHAALLQLRERRFHLVMTDLYMPVMDGFALVERIREEKSLQGIPVVVISAGGMDAQERAMALGVDMYLRKPVKFVEVLETVKQLLRIH
ncbi:MAG: TIGR02266 family protein [Myxococcaceae bacterium]|nr:TIGR02266 family protein [Myxococcaceae bacterium]MCI0671126.1 TIGR02266 family protein [Myxococcaceae bacterium]